MGCFLQWPEECLDEVNNVWLKEKADGAPLMLVGKMTTNLCVHITSKHKDVAITLNKKIEKWNKDKKTMKSKKSKATAAQVVLYKRDDPH